MDKKAPKLNNFILDYSIPILGICYGLQLIAKNFKEAHTIITKDPMILNELVEWKLQEWIPVFGELL